MLYTQSLPTCVFFVIRAVFIAAQLAGNFTTVKVQTFNIQKKDDPAALRAFLLHGSVAIPWLVLPWSDCHLCNFTLEKGKGSFVSV